MFERSCFVSAEGVEPKGNRPAEAEPLGASRRVRVSQSLGDHRVLELEGRFRDFAPQPWSRLREYLIVVGS